MRWVMALGLLGFASMAQAQEPVEPKLTLRVTVDQAMLIAQTLGAIRCGTVAELTMCTAAGELLRSIKEQARGQQ